MATRRRISGPLPSVPGQTPSQSGTQTTGPVDTASLMALSIGSTSVDVNIPEGALLSQVEPSLKLAVTGYQHLAEAAERLKPIIGRILLVISNRRMFRPDYRNLTEYVEKKVVAEYGMSRTSAFEALRIARAFPTMTATEYQKYGASRLLLATQVTDETDPQAKVILDEATRMSVDDFSTKVSDIKQTTAPPAKTFVVSVRLPLEWKQQWDNILVAADMTPGELFVLLMSNYLEHHPIPAAAPQAAQQPVGARA